jgi:hypothetical protein
MEVFAAEYREKLVVLKLLSCSSDSNSVARRKASRIIDGDFTWRKVATVLIGHRDLFLDCLQNSLLVFESRAFDGFHSAKTSLLVQLSDPEFRDVFYIVG